MNNSIVTLCNKHLIFHSSCNSYKTIV